MEFTTAVLCIITGLAVGALVGFTYHKKSEEKKFRGALSESERIIQEAAKKAEIAKRDILAEGKEEIHRLRQELDRDTKERRGELQRSERRLNKKKKISTKRSRTSAAKKKNSRTAMNMYRKS